MESLALFFSASGRLRPKPFARAVLAVYGTAFLSQLLISPPVVLRIGLAPFALVQAMAMWVWVCLHAKRLRDADRPSGPAVAIAVLYALAMILLLLIIALLVGQALGGVEAPGGAATDVLISSFLMSILTGDSDPGFFAYVAMGILGLIFAPMLIAMGFSIWTGTRRSAATTPTSVLP
jgi:uncharacterized membrane protein YhaH (DUF805 family)